MLSEHRDLAAAKAFFRSAEMVTGVTPARVTTNGHDAYPRAIRTELGCQARHRTSCYLNNRLEQDHHGIKGRCRPMLGLKSTASAARCCRFHDELRTDSRCHAALAAQAEDSNYPPHPRKRLSSLGTSCKHVEPSGAKTDKTSAAMAAVSGCTSSRHTAHNSARSNDCGLDASVPHQQQMLCQIQGFQSFYTDFSA